MLSLRVANLKSRNYLGLSTSELFRLIFLLLNFSWAGATCRVFSVCSHWQSKHHSSLTAVLRRECSPHYCHPKCPEHLPQTGTPPLPSAAGNTLQPELGTAGAMKAINPSWLFGPWLLWGFPKSQVMPSTQLLWDVPLVSYENGFEPHYFQGRLSNNTLICLQHASQLKWELRGAAESLRLPWSLHQNCL